MTDTTKTQKVILFPEDAENTREVEQSASYTTEDDWINVLHGGEELSMSRENWLKLQSLVNSVLPEEHSITQEDRDNILQAVNHVIDKRQCSGFSLGYTGLINLKNKIRNYFNN